MPVTGGDMTNRGLLDGRRALVTGAARGIGLAIARAFHDEGAQVALSDIDGGAAVTAAADLGSRARGYALDVTDAVATERVFNEAAQWTGGLDLVAANAGISTMNAVRDLTEEEWATWTSTPRVSSSPIARLSGTFARLSATGTEGVIVNTASLAAKIGAPYLAHYAASKFAVIGFTQSLAREVSDRGIRVNAVCPGYVRTSMQEREVEWEGRLRGMTPEAVRDEYIAATPLGRLEEPDDVASIAVFLASDLSRFLTGESINASGGVLMD